MGYHGISVGSILIVLAIVLLLFGTKRLRHIGSDLGAALKSFRKGMDDKNSDPVKKEDKPSTQKTGK